MNVLDQLLKMPVVFVMVMVQMILDVAVLKMVHQVVITHVDLH